MTRNPQVLTISLVVTFANAALALGRWLVHDLPRLLRSALIYVFVTVPMSVARRVLIALKALRTEFLWLLRRLAPPIVNILTWVLAIAIAPFYLLWRLLHREGRGPLIPPSKGAV